MNISEKVELGASIRLLRDQQQIQKNIYYSSHYRKMCQQFSRLLIKIKKVGAKDVRQFNDDNAHVKVT